MIPRHCEQCGAPVEIADARARFCKDACRYAFKDARRRAGRGGGHRARVRFAGLYLGSNPQPHEGVEDPERVQAVRRIHCRRYTRCLQFAAVEDWRGFSCTGCPVEDPLPHEAQQLDRDGLAAVLTRIGLPQAAELVSPTPVERVDMIGDGGRRTPARFKPDEV